MWKSEFRAVFAGYSIVTCAGLSLSLLVYACGVNVLTLWTWAIKCLRNTYVFDARVKCFKTFV